MTPSSPSSTESPAHVALVGVMGAGKSVVGRRLGRRLGLPFVDLDGRVEERAGASIAELFERVGEDGFRALEREALAEVLDGPPTVLATGGGAVIDPGNRRALHQRAIVVWLRVTAETASERVGTDPRRPLLVGGTREALARLVSERQPLYREVSHVVVDTDHVDPDEVVDEVAARVNAMGLRRTEP